MALEIKDQFPMCDWCEMDAFISSSHGRQHVMRDRKLFEWFYCRNEEFPDRANLLVAYDGSRLISILGYVPTTFLFQGQPLIGAWTALWHTLLPYRHGVGAILMRRLSELFDIVAGQGASLMNRSIVKAMSHEFVDVMPKVVYVIDSGMLGNWALTRDITVSIPRVAIRSDNHEFRMLRSESFSPNWTMYPEMAFSTLRDFAYLNHRYNQYPFMDYEVVVSGDRETPSVAVLRIIPDADGVTVGRLVEFFGPMSGDFEHQNMALIDHMIRLCMSRGCAFIDFYCTSTVSIRLFEKYGFVRDDEGRLPSLLDPVDFSRRHQNLEYFVSSALSRNSLNWRGQLYAARGDGDQDRPNATYAKARDARL